MSTSLFVLAPDAVMELPYEGGKELVLASSENREFISKLVQAVHDDLPSRRK